MIANRKHKFTVLLTTEERQMLETLAGDRGLNASDFIRQLIRNLDEARQSNSHVVTTNKQESRSKNGK